MRALFVVPIDHYFDDFIGVDVVAGGTSARGVVESFFLMLGPGVPRHPSRPMRSPEIDPDKTKPANTTNVVLGVVASMSGLQGPSPHVSFWADPERVRSVLADFRGAFEGPCWALRRDLWRYTSVSE